MALVTDDGLLVTELAQMNWTEAIDESVDRYFDQLVSLRRHLHALPEPSGEETQTSFYLYTMLGDHGLRVSLGPNGCGVVADLGGENDETARVAIRGDIDALRIHDEKEVVYRSQCDGVMHACGHDVHSAIAAGTMIVLQKLADKALPWPVALRGILQPAEETCQGASELIDAGVLENVDSIFSIHVDPTLQVGRVGLREGVLTASCDELLITIRGTGGHGARPHLAKDPIGAAADLIHALYLHIPRVTDSQEAVVLSIGQIHGGDNFNVIPNKVVLAGSLRTLDTSVRDTAVEHLMRIARSIGELTETKITIEFGISAPPVVNHPLQTQTLRSICETILGPTSVHEIPRPSMGSEDFAFYVQQVPGCMVRLGCVADSMSGHGLHTPLFDVDEEVIRIGVRIIARAVVESARPKE